jgi:glycosyltransferase involved in cell wall biosynthesis
MRPDRLVNATAPSPKSASPLPGWLFVLPWSLREIGGVNEVVKALIREFHDEAAFSPRLLITTEQPELTATPEAEVIETDRLNLWSPIIREHPVRGLISFMYRLPYRCWVLRRILKRHRIKVINPHFPFLGCLVFVIMKKLRLVDSEIVLSFHGSDVQNALSASTADKKLWKILLHASDHVVVVSRDLGNNVLALDPTIAPKMTTIYNGVDLDLFAQTEYGAGRQSPVPQDGKTILSLGAFRASKGHDVLVKAFSLVAKEQPDARLLLVGQDGPELPHIRNLVNSLSLEKRVSIVVDLPHERVPSLLARAQLFALASRKESFGLVITEAAAAKVPVVCTRAEGIRELITNGVTGTLVDIDDYTALADAILHVLRRPDDAKQMALAFYEQVKGNMTWHHAYAQYLHVAIDP